MRNYSVLTDSAGLSVDAWNVSDVNNNNQKLLLTIEEGYTSVHPAGSFKLSL